jgi:hypothetical protein
MRAFDGTAQCPLSGEQWKTFAQFEFFGVSRAGCLLNVDTPLVFRPSPAFQRSGSRFTRARSSEKFINVSGQSFCKTFKNGNSRILEPSLKATDVSPIDLCVDGQSFLGQPFGHAKPPNISRH